VFDSYVPFNLLGNHGLPALLDVKNIISAIDCTGKYDVLKLNPCDIYNRPMNYPRIWLWFPFSLATVKYLFIGLYLLYCGMLYRLFLYRPVKFKAWHGFLFFYFIFSPVTQLLLIRMNNDWILLLLIFMFVYLRERKQEIPAAIVLMAAIVLKLYPIILVITWAGSYNRKKIWIATITGIAGVAYFWFIRNDIRDIGKIVPSSASLSFGFKVMVMIVGRFVKKIADHPYEIKYWLVLVALVLYCRYYLFLLVTKVLIPAGDSVVRAFYSPAVSELPKKLFLAGGLIFLFTYCMGTNFDYRLVYLIFIFPLLMATPEFAFAETVVLLLALLCFLSEYSIDYVNDFLFVFPIAIFLANVLFRLSLKSLHRFGEKAGGIQILLPSE
jgi:hypothetical protein